MPTLNWTGLWSETNIYDAGDAVAWLGSSYVAAVANTDVPPNNNPSNWTLLAAEGAVGPQGSAGLNGAPGSGSPQGLNWRGAYSTLIGYNAYAVSICASPERPQQAFFLVNKKYNEKSISAPIFLTDGR